MLKPLLLTRMLACCVSVWLCTTLPAGPVPTNKPAAYPDWWFERDVIPRLPEHATLTPTSTPPLRWPDHYPLSDDYAVANIGQLKHIAKKAAAELDDKLPPPGAGPTVQAWVAAWQAAPAPGVVRDDYAAANLGQLKAVAKPFYDRLGEISPAITAPWLSTGTSPSDYAAANLGQVKNLFSFDPVAIVATTTPDDPLGPSILLIPSAEYTTADTATLQARITPAEGTTLAGLWLNNQPRTPVQAGELTFNVALAEGLNRFVLKTTDNLGHTRSVTAKIIRDTTLPLVAITSPTSGALITADSINLSGTVSGASPLKAVTVNGVSAYLGSGRYEASAVPLVAGPNTLTVTATDILGKTRTSTITVTAQPPAANPSTGLPPPPVTLSATPVEGTSPLSVSFTVVNNAPGALLEVTYDFEGTHKNLVTTTTLAPLNYIYNTPGTYYPSITIRTSVGSFSNQTGPAVPLAQRLAIKVAGEDSPLAAWKSLKQFVEVGDFTAAGEYLSETHKDGLARMLADLGPTLATKLLTDFGELQQVSASEDVAQYAADISTPDGIITFLVDCIKENGTWKIYSF
ncbi:MAG: hypothetical protein NTU80_04095 [Verrucomicrobia bacterium]|nr:hypothetical protein [Verrucomicrobiota bacterium]